MEIARNIYTSFRTSGVFRSLVYMFALALFFQMCAAFYLFINLARDWNFDWLGFAVLFATLAAINSLVPLYAWRHRSALGMRTQILVLDWSSAWLWFGVFGPLYQLMVVTLDATQMKIDALVYVLGVMICGSIVYTATQLDLSHVIRYMQTGHTDNPNKVYQMAMYYPRRVIFRNTTIAVLGYMIGSWQMHIHAGLPRIEYYKNIGVGLVLALFLNLFYYLVYSAYLGRARSRVIRQYGLGDQIRPRYPFRIAITIILVTLGSMFLATLIFVRSLQVVVQGNIESTLSEHFQQMEDRMASDIDEHMLADLQLGENGVAQKVLPGELPAGIEVADETYKRYQAIGSAMLFDNVAAPKLVAYKDLDGTRIVSVAYLNDYYGVILRSNPLYLAGGVMVLAAAVTVVVILARSIGSVVSRLYKTVREVEKTGTFHDPGLETGDEFELLSDSLGRYILQNQAQTMQINQEHARLRASIAGLQHGFMLTDTEGNILEWNEAASAILYGRSTTAPASLTRLAEDLPEAQPIIERLRRSMSRSGLGKNVSVEYGQKYLDILVTPIMLDGKRLGQAILIQDVTEGQVLSRSKDEFFSIASHELRTPLTVIRGNASMMLQMYDTVLRKHTDMREMITDMHQASTGLIEIVNDFLDVSRLEQGKMVFSKEAVQIDELTAQVVHDCAVLAETKGLRLELTTPARTLVPPVMADPSRVRQILYNLVGNALKFTNAGSVVVMIEHSSRWVTVTVTDTGRGISPQNQKLLFHKFQQASSSLLTRDATRGTGLGLYISRLMAQHMGGKLLLVASKVGVGSTFSVQLPVQTRSHTKK